MTNSRTVEKDEVSAKNYSFYRNHYYHVLYFLMVIIVLMTAGVGVVFYQAYHRPLPVFYAQQPKGQTLRLVSFVDPNLLPDTIIRWATKAATAAYTFDYVHYNQQLELAKPFFTSAGWRDYLLSVDYLISTITANQMIVNGVVSGTPVISNQGPLPGKGYTWRVQIPFLVNYQTGSATTTRNYFVILNIIRVPTLTNPQGIGVDQFIMITTRR